MSKILSKKKIKIVKIYVQSQWRVFLLWHHRFWQSSVHRERKQNKTDGLSKFTVGFLKCIPTHPIRTVVWGNFPKSRLVICLNHGGHNDI